MDIKGFTAGVEPGGLYRLADIQLLLCYVLGSVKEPIPHDMLIDVVVGNGMANFFETTDALEGLLNAGSVLQSEDDEHLLSITENGRVAVETLKSRLPRTLRDRSLTIALQALARRRNERETEVTVTDLPHGCSITCTIQDMEAPLMSLSLKVADRLQTELVKDKFLDNSDLLYRSIISILTGRAKKREEDGKTVIEVL